MVLFVPALAILFALTLFPALPLHFTFVFMILVVTLILGIVFLRSYEVHRAIAGIIFMTVLAPISGVVRRDVQIDGRRRSILRLNHHGLCVDDRGPRVRADIDLTIHAGDDLPRQHDADIHSACIT
jgi:hypothetical protein